MPYLFPEGAQFGADHVVLHATSKRHQVTGFAGPLSIKTVIRGAVAWNVQGRSLALDPGAFLMLGAGEVYSMNIDAPRPVETACLFFRDGFVESVARDMTAAADALDPGVDMTPLPWISRLHTYDSRSIVSNVQTLARRCSTKLMPGSFEEDLLLLARDLLLLYDEIRERLRGIRAEKASTREELFRRVETGREFMHSYPAGPLSLETVARAACLSRFHFHRAFVQVWRKTPHEYLTALRLQRARSLLESGFSVAESCTAAGFSSVSSFSRLFRSIHGVPPGRVREISKIGHSAGARQAVLSGS